MTYLQSMSGHAYPCMGFPSMESQRQDYRWHELGKYMYSLREADDTFEIASSDLWGYYTGPDINAIFVYDKVHITQQMNDNLSNILMKIEIKHEPQFTVKAAMECLARACTKLNLRLIPDNDRECFISIPIPQVLKPVQPDQAYQCPICLDGGEGKWVQPPCGHQFHSSCMNTWLRHHTTCPLCRQTIY